MIAPYRLPLDEIVSTTLTIAGFVQLSPIGTAVAEAGADVRFPARLANRRVFFPP